MYRAKPTITPIDEPFFDASADAGALRNAMKGMGTDETALISVLCNRSLGQRLEIVKAFKQAYGKDLVKEIESETSGNFEKVLVGLLTPRFDYLSKTLKKAVAGPGTKDSVLIDIICSSSNEDIKATKEAYKRLFGASLEDDIIDDTSGHFQRILVSLLNAGRDPDQDVGLTDADAEVDARKLFDAGEGQWNTDESVFDSMNSVMACRSFRHLRQVFSEYKKLCGRSMDENVKREFNGDTKNAMLAVVKCVYSPAAYFAERLQTAMVCLGTNDDTLIFILVSRCDIDLETIKDEYNAMYDKCLVDEVKSETSGDYRLALTTLLGEL